jgi:hypothetical protein
MSRTFGNRKSAGGSMRKEIRERRALATRIEAFKETINDLFPAPTLASGRKSISGSDKQTQR